MNRWVEFLNNMDARAWRTVWVTLALFAAVGVMIVLGKSGVLGVADRIEPFLASLRDSPLGLPAAILVFTLSAYIAAPQFLLIAACVVAFGPWHGFFYSWAGTVVSGVATFYTGRLGGAEFVRRYGGDAVNRLSRFIGRNDFLASLIVRNVPTAPFIVVNMAFGVSHARFSRFIAGLTVGVIPKTLIVALLGHAGLSAMGGGLIMGIGIAVSVVGVWITVALAARRAVRGEDAPPAAPQPAGADRRPSDIVHG